MTEMVSFKEFCHKVVDLPVTIVSKMIIRQNDDLPYLGQGLHIITPDIYNPYTWKMPLRDVQMLHHRIDSLSDDNKILIRQLKDKIVDNKPFQQRSVYRSTLKEYRNTTSTFLAWIEKYGFRRNGEWSDEPETILLQGLYDFETGNKLADHIWVRRFPDFMNGEKPIKQYLKFDANTWRYWKYDDTHKGTALSLAKLTNCYIMSTDEMIEWKNHQLAKRKNIA